MELDAVKAQGGSAINIVAHIVNENTVCRRQVVAFAGNVEYLTVWFGHSFQPGNHHSVEPF